MHYAIVYSRWTVVKRKLIETAQGTKPIKYEKLILSLSTKWKWNCSRGTACDTSMCVYINRILEFSKSPVFSFSNCLAVELRLLIVRVWITDPLVTIDAVQREERNIGAESVVQRIESRRERYQASLSLFGVSIYSWRPMWHCKWFPEELYSLQFSIPKDSVVWAIQHGWHSDERRWSSVRYRHVQVVVEQDAYLIIHLWQPPRTTWN